ncbi:MAG: hypothetical protein ACE5I5_12620 [Candidatus Heimdallarchaeota archaeon]
MLELLDRGRKPKLQLLSYPVGEPVGEKTKEKEFFLAQIKDISVDKSDYYKLVWIEDCPLKDLEDHPELEKEVSKALSKNILKYIVFTNKVNIQISVRRIEPPKDVKERLDKIFVQYSNLSYIVFFDILIFEEKLTQLGQLFAKILQIHKHDFNVRLKVSELCKQAQQTHVRGLWKIMWTLK